MNIRILMALLAAASAAPAQSGWTQLFNGKDLTGWKLGGDPKTFTVKDGAIVAQGPPAHAFYDGPASHNWKNFELMVDVMAAPNSNGGIYFHTEYQESGWPKKGFEVQVNNTYARDPVKSGSLYHVKDIGADDIKGIVDDNKWFTEHIIVQGQTVTIKLNGKEVVKWTQTPDWNGGREGPGRVIGTGTIALQGHDPGSTVHYKNIRIKPLP
jgi:hypothetical protein